MNEPNRTKIPEHGKPGELVLNEPEVILLDNGIKTYMIKTGDEEITRIDIVVEAGTAFQKKRLVASSVGDLLKEGTENYSSEEIATRFDECGAYFETSTSKDSTILTLFTLSRHLPALLPMIGDMLTNAKFHAEELSIHIERKRQEYLVNSEKVKYMAMLEFNQLIFGENAAYGQILKHEDFDKVNHDDLVSFYHSRYNPDKAYIIISGLINDDILSLVNHNLGNGWRKGESSHQDIVFVGKHAEKQKFISKEGALQSAIRIGRPIVRKTHPDYNKFILLNTVLGGYFGSRLMSNLREDKGYTYGINSFLANYIHGGFFGIATEVNAKSTRLALNEIYHELKKIKEKKVGKQELQLVKNYIYGAFLRNFDGPFDLADRFQSIQGFGLQLDFYRKSLDEIMQITAGELQDTANQYLDEKDMVTLVVGNTN